MPTYPAYKTFRGGFYDNKVINGANDREYSAKDIRKPYDTVFSDGIKPDADGTVGDFLKVTKNGDMGISISEGYAKLGGAWFENTTNYNITLDVASSTDRYDCVIIQNDDGEAVRAADIYIKSLDRIPTAADLTRTGDVYEICVAYIKVPAFATSITEGNITDTREDGSLCNVMSGVGATVVRSFHNTVYSESANQTVIPIGIPQFNRSRDILTVAIEGRIFAEGVNYTVGSNTHITLTIGLPVVGTRIDFEVAKNVNAAGAETVVQEVAELLKGMTAVNKKLEYIYLCNGVNDNVVISEMAQQYLSGGDNLGNLTISVIGSFGATSPYSGDGTAGDPYSWLALGNDEVGNRRVTLDFAGCKAVNLTQDNAYYCLFKGIQYTVKNLCLAVVGLQSSIYGQPVHFGTKRVYFENCVITAEAKDGWLFNYGSFRDCEFTIKAASNITAVFRPMLSSDMLRVYGGEHLAYTSLSSGTSAVVYCASDISSAVIIADGLSCPTKAVSGYRQTHAVYDIATAKYHTYLNLISELPISATSQTVRDTIVANK